MRAPRPGPRSTFLMVSIETALSSALALWSSRQLDELTYTTFSSPVCLFVLMIDAAVMWKAEIRTYFLAGIDKDGVTKAD